MSKRDKQGNLHSEETGRFVRKDDVAVVIKPIGAYEFNRLDTKDHIRHMMEMRFRDSKQYEKAAVEFFNSDRGKMYFSHARKRYYRYDENSGEMAVCSDGLIHTYRLVGKKAFAKISQQDKLEEVSYERIGGMPYLRD